MKKWQFFDLIRRVSELTAINEPIIVGSHCLFAVTDFVPEIVQRSVEADFLLGMHGHEMIEMVRDNLGHWSGFYEQQGYFADPLGMAKESELGFKTLHENEGLRLVEPFPCLLGNG